MSEGADVSEGLQQSFLRSYFEARASIDGWFMPDAALLFMICNQLIAAQKIGGDVLEIGVYHGLSAILTASLRGTEGRFYAADLFDDLQYLNTSRSGRGSKAVFLESMRSFHGNLDFMDVIVGPSSQLSPDRLGSNFSFCHVDGGHSAIETYNDIALCHRILLPGGLMAVDDYFNQEWPGVSQGAIRYMLDHSAHFIPIVAGFNKVVLQKAPGSIDLARYFAEQCPDVTRQLINFWETPTLLLTGGLTPLFDLDQSTPRQLVRRPIGPMLVRLEPETRILNCTPGGTARVRVHVVSEAKEPIRFDTGQFGLSYHLLGEDGGLIRWDNPRKYIQRTLGPQEVVVSELAIDAPQQPGRYKLELDIVWEGVAWLKERGLATALVDFIVGNG
jgi:hypothetical protein